MVIVVEFVEFVEFLEKFEVLLADELDEDALLLLFEALLEEIAYIFIEQPDEEPIAFIIV